MPDIASIVAPLVHAPPVPKEQGRASSKKDGANPDFAKLLREQAGADQSIPEAKLQSTATDGRSIFFSTSSTEESSIIEPPIEDQSQWVTNLAISDTGTVGVEGGDEGTQAKIPNLLLIETSGKSRPAVARSADEDSLILKQTLSIEPSRPKDTPHSDLGTDSRTTLKNKASSVDRKEKTEIVDSFPASGQILISYLSPSSFPLPIIGIAQKNSGAEGQATGPTEIPRSARQSGGEAGWLPPKDPAGTPTAMSHAGISLTASHHPEVEFDISGQNDGKTAMNSADDISPLRPASQVSLQVKRVYSDKLLSAIGTTSAPTEVLVAHGSTDAPGSGAHMGAAPSAAVEATTAANISPGAAPPNIYDRIDQGAAPVLLHSGAQHVSVGVHDPDLGWVEIQTQSAAGHVDATLITPSGQAHAALAAQLPAMAQYLEQRDVRVGNLMVHHHSVTGGFGGSSGGAGYGSANSGAGAHHSNPGNSGGERSAPGYGHPVPPRLHAPVFDTAARTLERGGAFRAVSFISVRA